MTRIILASVDASASLEYALPFDGIDYLNFFTSSGVMLRNLAGAQSTAIGAPTIAGGVLEAKSRTNFIRTSAAQSALGGTLIAAARCVDNASTNALAPRIISSYSSGTLPLGGAGLLPRNAVSMSGLLTLNDGGAYATHWTDRSATFTNWGLWAFRWEASGVARVENLTLGISSETTPANPIAVSANLYCIGSDNLTGGSNFLGESQIASVCIVSRKITDLELTEIAGRMRSAAAKSGITV
ncbi:MAG: hypothetical protein Q8M31_18445 [Beijerinckiaceae bacterium]|nr:hypothetical protein [Beijerinckiaceae bacterium]